ncbi:MAG: hypothetical protein CCU26_04770 [Nitrospira sp. UW-LDO-01]|nr:MAG: hypothetical protein CCU26_04770 [Nitrospira sp. UW-LDO-01]
MVTHFYDSEASELVSGPFGSPASFCADLDENGHIDQLILRPAVGYQLKDSLGRRGYLYSQANQQVCGGEEDVEGHRLIRGNHAGLS